MQHVWLINGVHGVPSQKEKINKITIKSISINRYYPYGCAADEESNPSPKPNRKYMV